MQTKISAYLFCKLILVTILTVFMQSGAAYATSVVDQRMAAEEKNEQNRYLITPRKPNYILPVAYRKDVNAAPYALPDGESLDHTEIKFQISLKFLLAEDIFRKNVDLYAAYTSVSFWQAYNENSAPFRETNYEPELFLSFKSNYEIWGFKNTLNNVGFVHQSNGRSDLQESAGAADGLSRSWNRIFGEFIFEKNNFVICLKPWWRIPEDEADDDNPDIDDYLGYGELHMVYKISDNYTVSAMLRNNMHTTDNKTTVELSLSFPLPGRLDGYIQYFNGYGESLIDYDVKAERIGIGVVLTNWL